MSINVYGAIKLARTLAQKSGLTIQLEDEARPRTDGRTLYLQRPSETWSKDEWVRWWGLFYHETGHNDPDMRDVFDLLRRKKIGRGSFFATGLNLVDDHRQEYHRINEYHGRKMALSQAHAQILDQMLTTNIIGQPGIDQEREAIETMFAFDTYCRERWMPTVRGKAGEFSRQLSPQSLQWYQALIDRYDEFDLKNFTTAEGEYENWKRIISEIFGFDADQKEQEAQASGSDEGETGDEEGQSSAGQDDDGDGDGDGSGRSTRKDEGKDSATRKERHAKYEDLIKHMHGQDKDEASYLSLHITYDKPTYGSWKLQDQDVIDYSKTGVTKDNYRYRTLINDLSGSGRGLANTVRRLLQIRSKAKRIYGQKKGKVSARNLHRLNIKDSKDYSERIFSQKHENNILDVAVCVLGDASGSMGGEKYAHMAQASILLNEAMNALRIPTELLTFTDGGSGRGQRLAILKAYGERLGRDQLVNRYCDNANHMHSNADGEAILYAYSRLTTQRNKRKILIVLSDGQPASSRGDADNHTRGVVTQIQKEGQIEIYGIGIMDSNVKRIYKDYDVINDAQELERALINVVQTKILS